MQKKKIVVLGCGAWGTTIANILAPNHNVSIFCHNKEIAEEINLKHINSTYLPRNRKVDNSLRAFTEGSLLDEVAECEIVFIVVASDYYRKMLNKLSAIIKDKIIVSATKGMEDGTNKSIIEITTEELSKKIVANQFVILSGPNLAKEIFLGKPAATVLACSNLDTAAEVQTIISTDKFRAYTTDDIVGVEYGGVIKNIIAIAAGITDAMTLGYNAKSALIVRAISEIKRYAVFFGAKEQTIMGLSGYGDLITTCMSPLSRNYSVGSKLGKGRPLGEILGSMVSIAEGVRSCKVIYETAKEHSISMPIVNAVYNVLYKDGSIYKEIEELMLRDLKVED